MVSRLPLIVLRTHSLSLLGFTACCWVALQNESPEHPDTKLVTLRGAPDNVAKAKESVKQLLEEALAPQEGEMEEKIPCPAGIVGRIIGRGGETIRWELQQRLHWGRCREQGE
jgi:hypothetical protein